MKFNINDYLEKINCPGCNWNEFKILRKSRYANIKNYEDLIKIYKSSADELLLDQLCKCDKCELVYLNPRIKSEIIYQSYTDNLDEQHISQDEQRFKTFEKSLKKIIKRNKIKNYHNKKFSFPPIDLYMTHVLRINKKDIFHSYPLLCHSEIDSDSDIR